MKLLSLSGFFMITADMLYIESPAGVGFSYTDIPSGLSHDDDKTQASSYVFICLPATRRMQ